MIELLTGIIFCISTVAALFWKKLIDAKNALKEEKAKNFEMELEDVREKAAARDIDAVIIDANKRWNSKRRED